MIVHQSSALRTVSMLIVTPGGPSSFRPAACTVVQAPTLLILSPLPSNAQEGPRSRLRCRERLCKCHRFPPQGDQFAGREWYSCVTIHWSLILCRPIVERNRSSSFSSLDAVPGQRTRAATNGTS